jgi:hypothetical protein
MLSSPALVFCWLIFINFLVYSYSRIPFIFWSCSAVNTFIHGQVFGGILCSLCSRRQLAVASLCHGQFRLLASLESLDVWALASQVFCKLSDFYARWKSEEILLEIREICQKASAFPHTEYISEPRKNNLNKLLNIYVPRRLLYLLNY